MATRRLKTRRLHIKGLLVAALFAGVIAAARANTPPNLLDDNRGDLTLEALETAAFNAATSLAAFPLDPLTFTYPTTISGRVLGHPKIHNLYLDDDWDNNNPDAPTMAQIDAFTQALVSSHYLDEASQYGVQNAEFTGSHGRSVFCIPVQPEFGHAEFVELLAWVTCEVGFNPVPPPGLLPAITGVPQTNDDTLYVIYLPRSMTIVDGGCDSLSGYHFFGAAPNAKFEFPDPLPIFFSQTFAYAVVPTACASGSADDIRNHITEAASHEILEAATDPLVGTGWINDSVVTDVHGNFFTDLINEFSNVSTDLKVGEAADICEQTADPQRGAPAFQNPTPPIPIPVSDSSLGNQILVAPFWSNQRGACAPFLPKSSLTFGTPSFVGGGGTFVTSSTPLTINATDGGSTLGVASVSFRFYPQGTTPTAFTTQLPPAQFTLSGADGPYTVDMFATGNNGMVEVTHSITVILDNTAPVISITSPTATQYVHSDTLTIGFTTSDGAGSGVASTAPSLDGQTTVAGHGLASGQVINLLTDLSLGPHSFSVISADHVANDSIASVSFSIIVTADSIKQDVEQFLAAGLIKNKGQANSLLAKLNAGADARTRGNCNTAGNNYSAFINELNAQGGKGVDAAAAAIMIADAQYLIAHCP
ncbi:MAG TPA: hypothetical protein VH583_08530 [Vicinamibacterales bacterium]|jgi:hypothetical protein